MAIINQERVNQAMEVLRAGLAPFIERKVQAAMKAGSVSMDAVRRSADDPMLGNKPLSQWNVAGLLKLTWDTWNAVFAPTLGRVERFLVQEVRDWRNKWAHQVPFSGDDTDRALDSITRLLTAVSAPQSDYVHRMKMERRRLIFDEKARAQRATKPGNVLGRAEPDLLDAL
ncbi:Swt1 family HEPN domain-containing protein [Rhodopila globiformis]|uniref:Swt1-like HEPN domain-containing protein n=1 Tax=Rhodopila globiformis TaxID=1071 RepID=A0A2S6NBS9_RHOGL|nr:Swt1 family HEPN domain-containing protein [Rhodopila globiformis]PPQ32057.1 hypothetical protein CCS01_16100 [Rhodopila globiformis]